MTIFPNNCFLSPGFKSLAGVSDEDDQIRDLMGIKFPIVFSNSKAHSSNFSLYAITPICLSGPILVEHLYEALAKLKDVEKFGGTYLQTRLDFDKVSRNLLSANNIHISYRTVYELDTGLAQEQWFQLMKRDSKSRFKKVLKDLNDNTLSCDFHDFNTIVNDATITDIYQIYQTTANLKGFGSSYQFSGNDFANLLADNSWALLAIRQEGKMLGFAILGDTSKDIDYTFAATTKSAFDISRALILCAFNISKNLKKNLCLGGGISENDELAIFKQRMGSSTTKFLNLKLISSPLLDEVGDRYFNEYECKRWPNG